MCVERWLATPQPQGSLWEGDSIVREIDDDGSRGQRRREKLAGVLLLAVKVEKGGEPKDAFTMKEKKSKAPTSIPSPKWNGNVPSHTTLEYKKKIDYVGGQ